MVDEYKLDGADMDGAFPDPGQSSQNFLALIHELRAEIPDKLLTTAVVSYGDEHGSGFPVEAFELFDFVNILICDGPDHGTMEQFDNGVSYWSERGLSREKIVMGAPFYAGPNMPYNKIVAVDPNSAQTDTFDDLGMVYHHNGIPTLGTKTRLAMEKVRGRIFRAPDHDARSDLSLVNAIHEAVHASP